MLIYAVFAQSKSSRVYLKSVANATNERDDSVLSWNGGRGQVRKGNKGKRVFRNTVL